MNRASMARKLVLAVLLLFVLAAFAMPLFSMLLTAMRESKDVGKPLLDSAHAATLGKLAANAKEVWTGRAADFPLFLHNSLFIAGLSVLGMVISSSIVAYGFSRLRWQGRDTIFILVLATLMIPFPILMAPLYLVFKQLGWIGTFLPLWVPAWFGGAFSIFLLRQFFLSIPRELDDAARIDGCSEFGVFTRIILPIAAPAIAVVALLQFVASWNDFLAPLLFLNHEETYTLALGLHMYQSQHGGTPWNLVMTAALLIILPVVVVFILAQRAIIGSVATQGLNE